jgi:hypothetical protein
MVPMLTVTSSHNFMKCQYKILDVAAMHQISQLTAVCQKHYQNMLEYKVPETGFQYLFQFKKGYNTHVWTQQITSMPNYNNFILRLTMN